MLKLIAVMIVPVMVFVYTCSFGRWLTGRRKSSREDSTGAFSVYTIAVSSLGLSGYVFWKLLM